MTPVEGIIEILDRKRELLAKLAGEQVAGFAIIIPPNGETIEFISLDSRADEAGFYTFLRDKIMAAKEATSFGGVTVPRNMR